MPGVFSTNVPKLSELVSNNCGARAVLQTSTNSKHFSQSRFLVEIGLFLGCEVRRGEGRNRWGPMIFPNNRHRQKFDTKSFAREIFIVLSQYTNTTILLELHKFRSSDTSRNIFSVRDLIFGASGFIKILVSEVGMHGELVESWDRMGFLGRSGRMIVASDKILQWNCLRSFLVSCLGALRWFLIE